MSERAQLFVAVLGMVALSRHVEPARGWRGRPSKDRQALASALVAKAVYGLGSRVNSESVCKPTGNWV